MDSLRPEINTSYNNNSLGAPQYLITSTNRTTHNSSALGPGFRPNYHGIQRYNLLERLRKKKENMIAKGAIIRSLDGWEPLPKIPETGKGLLVAKTIDGSVGYALEVDISEQNGSLHFTSEGGVLEVKKGGINDIYAFYVKVQEGGFYPSVYGGITGAKMLTPLIARQMMRMYEQVGLAKKKPLAARGENRGHRKTREHKKTRGHRKHKSKKLSRKKTRLNA